MKVIDGEVAREIPAAALDRVSNTAASVSRRLFGPSGVMPYQVILANGSARTAVVVDAATGDEAAEKALRKHPGQKVAYVGPASDEARLVDDLASPE